MEIPTGMVEPVASAKTYLQASAEPISTGPIRDNLNYREWIKDQEPDTEATRMSENLPGTSFLHPVPPIFPPSTSPLGDYEKAARGAFSSNTERGRASDLRVYASWCAEKGFAPLPALPTTIAAFVDTMAKTRAPATVSRYVSSIATAHRAIGHDWVANSLPVRMAKRRMYREKGRRQDQAQGLTWALRKRILKAAGNRLIDTRNRALLATAYDTLLRRSELTSLELADLSEKPGVSATVLVRRSKTDPLGDGAVAFLARDTLELVNEWIDRSGIRDGFLFRSLRSGVIGYRLDPSQVPRIYKAMARAAGLSARVVEGLSGHSTRVGPVQDMIAAGIGAPAIMQAGAWKSVLMVNRYGEQVEANYSGAAQLARAQKRL